MVPELPNAATIDRAVAILRAGGLVAFPTETVYGLGARALDPVALARIFAAKGRPTTHPLIAHVLGREQARELAAEWNGAAERLARAFWPGPLTLVVARAPHVPAELSGGGPTVGIRAPSHPVASSLLRAFGEPIAAPSANRYQSLSPTTAAHVAGSLGDRVDLILDGGACAAGIESTVVDVSGAVPRILRPGALDFPTLVVAEPRLLDVEPFAVAGKGVHASPGLDRRHYAPRATLQLAASRSDAFHLAGERARRGDRVALLLLLPPRADEALPSGITARALTADPARYAHDLFATLHAFDEGPVHADLILVEPVPDSPPWRAVNDRLRRASERS